jgi:hypothetical protein
MPIPFAAQLSIEVTQIAPVKDLVVGGAKLLYDTARNLRKSGSDLLVEVDLASIFGRGKVDYKLQTHFKDVVTLGSLVPLHANSPIMLDSTPGPTTQRAIKNTFYLSTVIQLSFLSWTHERTSLASALVECMNQRHEENLPGSNSDANYEGILGTLTAICAETARFPWALYIGLVESQLPRTMVELHHSVANSSKSLTPTLLLASMDYLYILQSLPEDRIMQSNTYQGLIPLLVWAHFILGLTVTVQKSPDGTVKFGQASRPSIIINWANPDYDTLDSVFLLDGTMDVVLQPRSTVDANELRGTICAQERVPLEGYGTTFLHRHLNHVSSIQENAPVYSDCVQLATTVAICMSFVLCRKIIAPDGQSTPHPPVFCTIERWRIIDSAKILFSGIDIDATIINGWVERNRGGDVSRWYTSIPTALRHFLGDLKHPTQVFMENTVIPCAILILIFSHVSELTKCGALPLVYGFNTAGFRNSFVRELGRWDWVSPIQVTEDEWFYQISKLLIGVRFPDLTDDAFRRAFLLSEFGWSIFLSNVGEFDPSEVNFNLICVREGTPFSRKTQERKYRILDAPPIADVTPPNKIMERGQKYVPRCVSPVTKSVEHYSSRTQEFWRTCRFDVDETASVLNSEFATYSVHCSYRQLHRTLCSILQTDSCEHGSEDLREADLALDAVTVKGFEWSDKEGEPDSYERVCILLVKGDSRARWLALAALTDFDHMPSPKRQVMLRTNYCCESCAVEAAARLPGKWLVIL